MGYSQLLNNEEDLEKLAGSLRRRIAEKQAEKEELENGLRDVELKLKIMKRLKEIF